MNNQSIYQAIACFEAYTKSHLVLMHPFFKLFCHITFYCYEILVLCKEVVSYC